MEEIREDEIDLRDYLRVILKRRWTIIAVFSVIVFTVAVRTLTAVPIYKSTTRVIIEKENPNVVSIKEVTSVDASGDYYRTQYKIIESRNVAREVITRMDLDGHEEFFPRPREGFYPNLKRSIHQTISFWIDSIASLLKREDRKTGDGALEEAGPSSGLVSSFIGRIEVEPISNSRLVDISFHAKDPVLATRITNTLADAYIGQNLAIKLSAVKDAVIWLHNQIDEERRRVEKAEQALLKYKEEHRIITDFSSDTERITAQKLAQLNTKVVEAESTRVEAETRYKQALALEGSPDMLDSIPEVLNNQLIRQIKTMEVQLYKRMSELSKKYGQKHPQMVAVDSELKTIQKRKNQEIERVINSLRNEYRVAKAREQSLKAALATQKKESLDLNQKAIQYGVFKREAESARHMYDLLIKRFKETTLTEDMRTGNIRVIDRAEIPKSPVKPRKKLNILLAMIVGLMVGIFLAFLFEFLDNTIKLPEDIKGYLNLPYLGLVPAMDGIENGKTSPGPEMITLHSPMSKASEAYRGIRTSILFSLAETEPRVILVSSAGPQEGKTITTTNLAITMAQAGSDVIVLDCDMRRPKVHKVFGAPQGKGISNILVGDCKVKDAVIHTEIPNLHIIPSGTIPPNPSEILGSRRMTNLLELLKNRYHRIIIDSPPAMAVTDAVVLTKVVDGVVMVVRAGFTNRDIIKNGLEQFQAVNAHMLGAVLNNVDMEKDGHYYYHYYYYYGDEGGNGNGVGRQA